jgi:hypothetical protein
MRLSLLTFLAIVSALQAQSIPGSKPAKSSSTSAGSTRSTPSRPAARPRGSRGENVTGVPVQHPSAIYGRREDFRRVNIPPHLKGADRARYAREHYGADVLFRGRREGDRFRLTSARITSHPDTELKLRRVLGSGVVFTDPRVRDGFNSYDPRHYVMRRPEINELRRVAEAPQMDAGSPIVRHRDDPIDVLVPGMPAPRPARPTPVFEPQRPWVTHRPDRPRPPRPDVTPLEVKPAPSQVATRPERPPAGTAVQPAGEVSPPQVVPQGQDSSAPAQGQQPVAVTPPPQSWLQRIGNGFSAMRDGAGRVVTGAGRVASGVSEGAGKGARRVRDFFTNRLMELWTGRSAQ